MNGVVKIDPPFQVSRFSLYLFLFLFFFFFFFFSFFFFFVKYFIYIHGVVKAGTISLACLSSTFQLLPCIKD
jgi:hypothetical protein